LLAALTPESRHSYPLTVVRASNQYNAPRPLCLARKILIRLPVRWIHRKREKTAGRRGHPAASEITLTAG